MNDVKDRKTLFVIVPYGIGWRTIVNEKSIAYLTDKDFTLVIIAESPEISVDHPNVFVERLKHYQRGKLEIALGVLRNYVLADTSRKYSETLDLKVKAYLRQNKVARIIRETLGKRLSRAKEIRSFLSWLDQTIFEDRLYRDLFEKYKPSCVFTAYPFSFLTYPILRRARKHRVPTIAYVSSWDNLTSKWEVPAKYDQLLVWNQVMKDEAVEFLDYRPQDVKVCGVPQFDLYADTLTFIPREHFIKLIGADPRKKLITYTTGTPNVEADPDIVETVYEAMQEGRFSEPCQLLIRLHPRRDKSEFEKFKGREGVILQHPGSSSRAFSSSGYFWESGLSDYKVLANTLAHSDVIINVSSTITIEACVLDRPVINIGFDGRRSKPYPESVKRYLDYTHYKNVLRTGGVRVAWSKDDLVEIVNAYLENPKLDTEGRKMVVDQQCYKVDGLSLERMLKYLSEYVER